MNCDWATIVAIIGTGVTVLGFVYGCYRNLRFDIDTKMDKLGKRLDDLTTEVREDIRENRLRIDQTNQRMDQTNQRLDQLYQTIIDLLHQKPKTNP